MKYYKGKAYCMMKTLTGFLRIVVNNRYALKQTNHQKKPSKMPQCVLIVIKKIICLSEFSPPRHRPLW
jgi:hypothetical protein